MRLIVIGLAAAAICLPVEARPRSAAVRAFIRANPCPVADRAPGTCPGWQVDHITPLKCGGADSTDNLQWLTMDQHKAKTAAEAGNCRPERRKGKST